MKCNAKRNEASTEINSNDDMNNTGMIPDRGVGPTSKRIQYITKNVRGTISLVAFSSHV